MDPSVRQATGQDTDTVVEILREAARWLEERGTPMWRDGELVPARLAEDIEAGLLFIADCGRDAAGVVKFQLEDEQFWPDVAPNESAFVHRLAVRRKFAGGTVSSALLRWSVARARSLGKSYLRLDCEASRARLRAVYEKFGFTHHSDRHVGPYFVSRYEYLLTSHTDLIQVNSEEQIAEVVRLAREIWQEHYLPIIGQQQVDYMLEKFQSPRALEQQLKGGYEYFLTVLDSVNGGYLAILPEPRSSTLLISKLYVREAARGLGLGKDMLKFVESQCSKNGIKTIWLTVNKNNTDSIAWYSRMGFQNVGPVVADIGGGFVMDDFKMEKIFK
jgi:GNAT superfamily N-acetyltransferase